MCVFVFSFLFAINQIARYYFCLVCHNQVKVLKIYILSFLQRNVLNVFDIFCIIYQTELLEDNEPQYERNFCVYLMTDAEY